MKLRTIICAAALVTTVAGAWGAPSRQRPVKVTDADGNPVTVVAVGDEHSRRYIRVADGTPAEWIASRGGVKSFIPAAEMAAAHGAHAPRRVTTFPTLGENRFLVILVEFADKPFSVEDPRGEMDAMFNAPGYDTLGGTGSVRDYYTDCSAGLFSPYFDVVGPVRMKQNVAYYGSGSDDSRAGLMVMEACRAVDYEVDFTLYDHDGNGEVDSVYFIYAGKGEADGGEPDTIWPHSWNLSDQGRELTLDGVAIQGYACSPELDGSSKLNGMGTPCHEFAHVLGLPDLYCTNSYVECLHPSDFSLMARGNYLNDGRTPPALSAYERYELGWLTPRELTHPATVALRPLSESAEACRIGTERVNEYFLFENRQRTGWDTYLPAHGMLVWHIDYSPDIWDRNRVNANPSHQYVDIVEANCATSFSQASGFTFPGTGKVTSFTSATRPALASWSGLGIDLPVTGIAESADGIVTFDVAGGKEPVGVPSALRVVSTGMTGFTIEWSAAPGADRHTVRLIKTDGDDNPIGEPRDITVDGPDAETTISGLWPGDIYRVQVRGADKYEAGEWSEAISVRLPAPTFEYLKPVGLSADEITHHSFTARWEPMAEAERYRIDLTPRFRREEIFTTVDFTDKTVPEGYTTTSSTWVSMAGHFGEAAPALRLGADGDMLESPLDFTPVSSVQFWIKAQQPDPEARIIIEEYHEGAGTSLIASFTPAAEATTVRFDVDLPMIDCATGIRIRFKKAGKCTVNIDDVKLGFGGRSMDDDAHTIVRFAEGGATGSLTVDGLTPETPYSWTVRGINAAGTMSWPSDALEFTTGKPSGTPEVNDADADTPVDVYTTTGILLLRHVSRAEARRLLPRGVYIAGGSLMAI